MRRCPSCMRLLPDNAMVVCPYDDTPLLDTLTKFDDQAKTLEIDYISEEDKRVSQGNTPPSKIEAVPDTESIVDPIVNTELNKIPLLLLLWVQLIIANYLFFGIVSGWMGGILSIFLILLLPLSIIISRFVNRNIVLSIFIGGLVAAMIEGGLGYSVRDWAARYGIVYGAFFGASLTLYFSKEYKYTNSFWASVSTLLIIAIIVIPECVEHGAVFIIEILGANIGDSLQGAIMAIGMGLMTFLFIKPLQRFIEYVMDQVVDIYGIGY
jgi:hypothetical protein